MHFLGKNSCILIQISLWSVLLDVLVMLNQQWFKLMAWRNHGTSHNIKICWTRSMKPYGIIKLQWVNPELHVMAYSEHLWSILCLHAPGSLSQSVSIHNIDYITWAGPCLDLHWLTHRKPRQYGQQFADNISNEIFWKKMIICVD